MIIFPSVWVVYLQFSSKICVQPQPSRSPFFHLKNCCKSAEKSSGGLTWEFTRVFRWASPPTIYSSWSWEMPLISPLVSLVNHHRFPRVFFSWQIWSSTPNVIFRANIRAGERYRWAKSFPDSRCFHSHLDSYSHFANDPSLFHLNIMFKLVHTTQQYCSVSEFLFRWSCYANNSS